MKVSIYTDGSARGNPDGPGGYGTILQYIDAKGELHERELSAGYKKTTNNRMELMAAIVGLEALKEPCRVTLVSDSRYLIDGMKKGWAKSWKAKGWKRSNGQPALNPDLWERLLQLFEIHEVELVWVKSHAGHEENERCDQLATGWYSQYDRTV